MPGCAGKMGQMPAIYELVPFSFAFGGETLCRLPDGRVGFIPYTIPGERVKAEIIEEKGPRSKMTDTPRFARLRLLEVIEPSTARIEPRCPHFSECGGCHYQHLNYTAQVEAKASILADQLRRIGGLQDSQIQSVFPSPKDFNYRNYVQFHLAPDGALGYRKARSDRVLPIHECHLPEMTINQAWPLLTFDPGAPVERVGLRLGTDEEMQLILETSSHETPALSVEELAISVVHLGPTGPLVLAGSPAVEIEVLGRRFQVSAGSFFQTNTAVAEQMVKHVIDQLDQRGVLHSGTIGFDLFCGVGLFSAFLAEKVGRLVGIETSPTAVDDFAVNLDEFDQVEIYEGLAEHVLPDLDLVPDFIVVDPPREGLDRRLLDAVIHNATPLLVYVSCDPATLARDAKRLSAGGYQLENLALFDQFPQTYHIESISVWVKSA